MERKEFNKVLRDAGFSRESEKDEFGDYDYIYNHEETGLVLNYSHCGMITVDGSKWAAYNTEGVAVLLVGALALGKGKDEILELYDDLIGGYE